MITICTYDPNLLPTKKTPGAVCFDLHIAQDIVVQPHTVAVVGTGVKFALPMGRHTKIYARSSLPKYWLMLANSVAVMDADYRWEYMLQFYNFTNSPITHKAGDRLAQFEILPYLLHEARQFGTKDIPNIETIVDQNVYDDFANRFPTDRWDGRFGSTWL